MFDTDHRADALDKLLCYETMVGKNFHFECKLGWKWYENNLFLTIYRYSKFQDFAETNSCFSHNIVVSNIRPEIKDSLPESHC